MQKYKGEFVNNEHIEIQFFEATELDLGGVE
jgi:hypothetical protein